MFTQQLFELALNITNPWYIKDIQFSVENKRLDIHVDFRKGAVFHYESADENISGDFKVYDTVDKQWRHLRINGVNKWCQKTITSNEETS